MVKEIKVNVKEHYPVLNVKVYDWIPLSRMREELILTESQAQQVSEDSFSLAQELFWTCDAPALAESNFGDDVSIYQLGRMGGWLAVDGLDHPDDWTGKEFSLWARFKGRIDDLIEGYMSIEFVKRHLKIHQDPTEHEDGGPIEIPSSEHPCWTARLRKMDSHRFMPQLGWPDCEQDLPSGKIKENLVKALDQTTPDRQIYSTIDIKELPDRNLKMFSIVDQILHVFSYGLFSVARSVEDDAERCELYMVGSDRNIYDIAKLGNVSRSSTVCIGRHLSRLLDATNHRI